MKDKVRLKIPIDVVPNGVNFETFKPGNKKNIRIKLGLDENDFVVLFLGNPKLNRKNFNLAKEGFDKFSEENRITNAKIITPFGVSQSKLLTI